MDELRSLNKEELLAYIYFMKHEVSLSEANEQLSRYLDSDVNSVTSKLFALKLISFVGSDMIVVVNDISL